MGKDEPKSRSVFYTTGLGNSTLHRNTFEECSDRMKTLMFAPTPPPKPGRDAMNTNRNTKIEAGDQKTSGDANEGTTQHSGFGQDISCSSTTAILPDEEEDDIAASQAPVYRPLSQPMTLNRAEAENSMKECIKKAKGQGPPQKKRSTFHRIWKCAASPCSSNDVPSSAEDVSSDEEDDRKSNSKKKPSSVGYENKSATVSQ